ncbi:FAD-dependent oxidoreductase [Specibacter cremeus]|uniref:FAD-dependent oxidoreductase n=1 Tax=Specibacter cremeus TaxID=1629051 RepID=UPI000F767858|nr:NAD(P)/FAD-dependent oxidoreductase [Specibacter cremeus]
MLDVVIVGGGPVGLCLAALLLRERHSVRVLERRGAPGTDSRAIGIHPPALHVLRDAGVHDALLREGVRVPGGVARSRGGVVGSVSFAASTPANPFVLTIPQARTEALLARRVDALDPRALVRGAVVVGLDDGGQVTVSAGGRGMTYRARLVVGADGARSTVRAVAGIRVRGRDYPDSYLMGDFADTGDDGVLAVLYLEAGGIVESFPLPGGMRRWVAHTDTTLHGATAAQLATLIRRRTGVSLEPETNTMLSPFTTRVRRAERMVSGRIILIGDAAHEISPIGGLGMNLGWLDAAALAPVIGAALAGHDPGPLLAAFDRTRRRAAGRAVRQSALNMALGRPLPGPVLAARNAVLRQAFGAPWLNTLAARRFSMQ